MKVFSKKGFLIAVWCIVALIIAVLLRFYFVFVSEHIYKDSATQLSEVYMQVDKNFNAFLKQGWNNLDDWDELIRGSDAASVERLLNERRETWGFSNFLFISADYSYLTAEGNRGTMPQLQDFENLFLEQKEIMSAQELPDGRHFTILAIPVEPGVFNGFEYNAIAIAYLNTDMAETLDTNAFNRESTCFILRPDGQVVLSTHAGGTVFNNYLTYLGRGSNLTEAQLASIKEDMLLQKAGVVVCEIGGVRHYLSYEPVGYEDYFLFGVVPESAVSASMIEIQKVTVDTIVKVALLLGIALIIQLVYSFRKRARQNALELKYRDFMFSILSDTVDDITIMVDGATWKADYISNNLERLLGVSVKDTLADLRVLNECNVDNEPGIAEDVMRSIHVGEHMAREREHINIKTGQRRAYLENIYHEKLGDTDKFFIIMSDRTQEREMTESLREALETAKSANAAKSTFLSSMSHDIRTPMNSIMGFTELLDMNADQPDKVHTYVEKISASGNHLLGLINDILDMSKIESGKTSIQTEPFKVDTFIENICDIMIPQAEAKNQTFTVVRDEHLHEHLIGDKLRINQIMLNLLSNAVKYTPEGGRITFEIKSLPSTSSITERVGFIVSDNGVGMTPEYLETIFEPFTREVTAQTKSIQGTGLGMAITKNLVDLMGGLIEVESELGKGTTFTVELDLERSGDDSPAQDEGSGAAVNQDALKGLHILMAEDNEMSALMLTERLDIEGATVEVATNGQEAIDLFTSNEPGHFDLILMDVEMPFMGGYEATTAIRNLEREDARTIPIFAMTANVFAEDVKRAHDAGMDEHLGKPVDMDQLKINADAYVRR